MKKHDSPDVASRQQTAVTLGLSHISQHKVGSESSKSLEFWNVLFLDVKLNKIKFFIWNWIINKKNSTSEAEWM